MTDSELIVAGTNYRIIKDANGSYRGNVYQVTFLGLSSLEQAIAHVTGKLDSMVISSTTLVERNRDLQIELRDEKQRVRDMKAALIQIYRSTDLETVRHIVEKALLSTPGGVEIWESLKKAGL